MNELNKGTSSNSNSTLLWGLSFFFALAFLATLFYWIGWARFYESTNDAYVSGNLIYVTPQSSGIVQSIHVDDAQLVEEGHVLVTLDPTDFLLQVEKDKAELASEVRSVSSLFLQTKQAKALWEIAQQKLQEKTEDFERRVPLVSSGSVSEEELEHTRCEMMIAFFEVEAKKAYYLSLLANTHDTTVKTHPRVQKAIENLKKSWLLEKRSVIKAPSQGLIAQRSIQVGQRVKESEPLLAVIPLDQLWVDANFKEVQIGSMQIGQKVVLTSDTYGSSVKYHGKILGIGGGTGSVFSLLPPQNATGNWIKIVQRLPVRISLDPSEIAQYPLRLGLSMEAKVNIRDIGEAQIPEKVEAKTLYQTSVFDQDLQGVDEVIASILKDNELYEEAHSLKDLEE